MLSKLKLALRSFERVTLLYYLLFAVLIVLVLYPTLMLLRRASSPGNRAHGENLPLRGTGSY